MYFKDKIYQKEKIVFLKNYYRSVADKYVLGKDISLGRGLKGAALSGLFMERAMATPSLYQDISSVFAGKNYKQQIAENNAKRIAKENLLSS